MTSSLVEHVAQALHLRDQERHQRLSDAVRETVLANPPLRAHATDLGESIWRDMILPSWQDTSPDEREGWYDEARTVLKACSDFAERNQGELIRAGWVDLNQPGFIGSTRV